MATTRGYYLLWIFGGVGSRLRKEMTNRRFTDELFNDINIGLC